MLRHPAGDRGGLQDPGCDLRLIEIVLMDVEPARLFTRSPGWDWVERRSLEKSHLDEASEDVERHKPAMAFDAVKG